MLGGRLRAMLICGRYSGTDFVSNNLPLLLTPDLLGRGRFCTRESNFVPFCLSRFACLPASDCVNNSGSSVTTGCSLSTCGIASAPKAGIRFAPPPEGTAEADTFWQSEAPTLLERALDVCSIRFAAVIVDEAQDFLPNWWLSVELLNEQEEEGPLYVFYDPHQNVHLRDQRLTLPDIVIRYRLPTNCRNTQAIAAACGRILGVEGGIPVRDDAPHGINPRVEVASDAERQKTFCELQLADWISKGRLRPNQVVILSPWRQSRSSLAGINALRGVQLTNDLKVWRNSEAVLFETIKRFKGLEADALLMIDVPMPDSRSSFTLADLYVACSRGKHLVTILTTNPDVPSLLCGYLLFVPFAFVPCCRPRSGPGAS